VYAKERPNVQAGLESIECSGQKMTTEAELEAQMTMQAPAAFSRLVRWSRCDEFPMCNSDGR